MSAPLREHSYWSDTVAWPTIQLRDWPAQVDVAVVGGGYTGLSAARELAKRGATVAVFEAHTFGWGGSSRNGGMVLTGLKLGAGKLVKKYGLETARKLFCTSLDAIAYAENLIRDEAIHCDFARCGHVELAWKPEHFAAYQHEAEMFAHDFGHPVKIIKKVHMREEVGSDVYHGALLDEASAGVNPAKYAAGLTAAAQRAGAYLFENTCVTHLKKSVDGHVVETARGALRAREVIVATNGYTSALTPYLHKRIIPIGSYIIATEPLSDALAREVSPTRRMMFDSKNFLYYWRLSADNRMVFGGRAGFMPETPMTVRESAAILQRGMLEIYPQLKGIQIDYAWGGTLGFSFDLLPHAGRTDDGAYYAMGCGGHGVALLTYLGACLAKQISGEPVDTPLLTMPFPTAPLGLYNGNPWFLPFAGAYYKILDVIS
jgi:glycine/D-amino acid oxidase-like deaminating enzyme